MRKTIIISTAGFLLILAVLITTMMRSPHDTQSQSATAEPETQQPIAARPACPPIGEIDLPCLGAERNNQGKDITVVNLWAWWCVPCRTELPLMQQLAAENPQWAVVGVHADQDAARGAQLLTDLGIDLPSYQDDNNAFAGTLGLPSVVPITVVFRGSEKLGVIPRAFTHYNELATAIGKKQNQ